MKRQLLHKMAFTTLSIFFCAFAHSAKAQSDLLKSQEQIRVEPAIRGEERQAITNLMLTLRPQDQKGNVVLITGDQIYTNTLKFRNYCSFARQIGDNTYEDKYGHQFSLPVPAAKPSSLENSLSAVSNEGSGIRPLFWPAGTPHLSTGPYRQVYSGRRDKATGSGNPITSDTDPGYSYESANITLPFSRPLTPPYTRAVLENLTNISRDTSTIYLGGWSASAAGNPTYYDSVDAGFYHDNGYNIPTAPARKHTDA